MRKETSMKLSDNFEKKILGKSLENIVKIMMKKNLK